MEHVENFWERLDSFHTKHVWELERPRTYRATLPCRLVLGEMLHAWETELHELSSWVRSGLRRWCALDAQGPKTKAGRMATAGLVPRQHWCSTPCGCSAGMGWDHTRLDDQAPEMDWWGSLQIVREEHRRKARGPFQQQHLTAATTQTGPLSNTMQDSHPELRKHALSSLRNCRERAFFSSGSQQETDSPSNGIPEQSLMQALFSKMEVGLRETKTDEVT